MPWVPEPLRLPLRPLHHALRWLSLRRIHDLPLLLTVAMSDWLFRRVPDAKPQSAPAPLDWGRGVSVVIPERGGVDLLASCLAGLYASAARIDEPFEVIIVVNGSPASEYEALASRYPEIRWRYFENALGFTRAVLQGVAIARFDAIYLLNNDMQLAPEALSAVLSWRAPQVFAIASQILFPNDGRRREETGWTFMPFADGLPAPYHAESSDNTVRGTVWAGAGSALFHAARLRKCLPESLAFDPFYWEDVDLGVRAWHAGYECLYCPDSRALHLHRVTVQRYFKAVEVERIFERNRLQFQLRNPFPLQPLAPLLRRIRELDPQTVRELGRLRACIGLWRARWQAFRAPFRDLTYASMSQRSYRAMPVPRIAAKRPILWVSPFAVLPPRHGGAIRTHRLANELARDYPLILLSDEAGLYENPSHASYAPFTCVHLVDGRAQLSAEFARDRLARMRSHAHAGLRLELRRLIQLYQPCAVVVEHMELAELVDLDIQPRPIFLLSVQDVLLTPEDSTQRAADEYERGLIARFDAVIVCSPEDQALLESPPIADHASKNGNRVSKATLVANGCDLNLTTAYRASAGRNILFMGPFRAAINWDGILAFVERIYPTLQAQVPGVSLTILGGIGAQSRVANLASFTCPSIKVLDTVDSIDLLLQACALTINPQAELRGSSLKVIESLAGGRVCVSTEAGARGHAQHGFAGLAIAPMLADFTALLTTLLLADAHRIALEQPDLARLQACGWAHCALSFRKLIKDLCPA